MRLIDILREENMAKAIAKEEAQGTRTEKRVPAVVERPPYGTPMGNPAWEAYWEYCGF